MSRRGCSAGGKAGEVGAVAPQFLARCGILRERGGVGKGEPSAYERGVDAACGWGELAVGEMGEDIAGVFGVFMYSEGRSLLARMKTGRWARMTCLSAAGKSRDSSAMRDHPSTGRSAWMISGAPASRPG
ncbi:MAG TPA: hypothetical protein VEF71_20240, partial [Streptosporangiaceae bacterium]|nr:hypothetical protein [Streptosporangiaceae bacterium]